MISKRKQPRPPLHGKQRRKGPVPRTPQAEKGIEASSELFSNYVEALRDSQFTAQKQYYAAYRAMIESIQGALREMPLQDAARAYSEGLQSSLAGQDVQKYLETSRQFYDATQDAHRHLERRVLDAYKALTGEMQQIFTNVADVQKTEFGNLLKCVQEAFGRTDVKNLDAATLARVAQTLFAAAWIRAQFG
jgi:hypothetical protein